MIFMKNEGDSSFSESFATKQKEKKEKPEVSQTDLVLKRSAESVFDSLTLRYGRLSENHPAQKFASQILERLQTGVEAPSRIVVLPQMKDLNAMVSSDGTIFVSLALMNSLDSVEAFYGVVAHELIHHKHQDIKTKLESSVKTSREWVTRLCIDRLEEYRADLEGAVSFLDERGINPLGYKKYLESLHWKFSKTYDYQEGVQHGSLLDRSLLFGVLARYYDMSSLSRELTAIDPEEKKRWSEPDTQTVDYSRYLRLGKFERFRPPSREEAARDFALLSVTQRGAMLSVMADVRLPLKHPNYRFGAPIAKELVAQVDKDISDITEKEEDFDFLKLLHYELNLGLGQSLLVADEEKTSVCASEFEQAGEKIRARLSSLDEMKELRAKIPQLNKHSLNYACGRPADVADDFLSYSVGRNFFGPLTAEGFSFEVWFEEANLWAEALIGYGRDRSVMPAEKDQIVNQLSRKMLILAASKKQKGFLKAARAFLVKKQIPVFGDVEKESLVSSAEQVDLKEDSQFLGIMKGLWDKSVKSAEKGDDKVVYSREVSGLEMLRWLEKFTSFLEDNYSRLFSEKSDLEAFQEISKSISVFLFDKMSDEKISSFYTEDKGKGEFGDSEVESVLQISLIVFFEKRLEEQKRAGQINEFKKAVKLLQMFAGLEHFGAVGLSEDFPVARESDYYVSILPKAVEDFFREARFVDEAALKWFFEEKKQNRLLQNDNRLDKLIARVISIRLADSGPEQIFENFDRLTGLGIPVLELLSNDLFRDVNGRLIFNLSKNLGSFAEADRLRALDLIYQISQNPLVVFSLKRYSTEERWCLAGSFEEKLAVAFDRRTNKESLALKDRLIEEEMETQVEVAAVRREMKEATAEIFHQGDETIGWVALSDHFRFHRRQPLRTVEILLGTAGGDRQIKEVALGGSGITQVNWDKKSGIDEAKRFLVEIDRNLNILFCLSDSAKHFLVKKLLVDSGLLRDQINRRELLEKLIAESTEKIPSQAGVSSLLAKISSALARNEDWELLYFALAPTLAGRLALVPPHRTPWGDFVEFDIIGLSDRKKNLLSNPGSLSKDAEDRPWNLETQYNALAEAEMLKWLQREGVLETREGRKLSPMELIVDIAQRTGSMGVRFLQLLPQFLEINSEHQKTFNSLYDQVRGQSKLAAVAVVEREWPELWTQVKRFGQRLGGGSLMCVYEIETMVGETKVIRVRNPNIVFHMEATKELLAETVEQMHQDRSLTEDVYRQVRTVLDFVDEWIRCDIDFSNFLVEDEKFHQANHDFTRPGLTKSIYIPKSEGPASDFFQIEEKIPGRNLTEWEALEQEGQNLKEVIALIVSNSLQQMENGQLHGDIHPGNYRVMPDGRVAILDRTFYINLDETEKKLVSGIISGQIDLAKAYGYLTSLVADGKTVDRAALAKELQQLAVSFKKSDFVAINRSLIGIRRLGIEVPMKITLIIKNISALNNFCRQAGFTSLSEAASFKVD
ncbi:MAG: hypothetical protein UW63_C0054G0004 [Candidatus Uhrbacteria bacterium GW2011_GWF2_44_350]|uniref:ABC1 atypical kinase-like domain-containing protein n=1 Tax=Candidatus Uhrbacteria bacterium GW2011_GWF2_44_350 TaxID=1619000 RepID=A0A0G1MC82_9BACT|nr:MAG: hypothetical protein UW63_C0054G0004 [Candidatus Uhrbacteria bacterium GW2011_GWF2_44_350]HBR80605.1 hypothetical protein [Candidatus Uhrbacteria bacterium]HCU31312.1 hypothetical protein [Candidatus Uhrbacteria bacterium]